jgi:hypothetical protein
MALETVKFHLLFKSLHSFYFTPYFIYSYSRTRSDGGLLTKSKSKAVPLHAMVAHGGRGGIAPTHT